MYVWVLVFMQPWLRVQEFGEALGKNSTRLASLQQNNA